jgi:hypothetical protein
VTIMESIGYNRHVLSRHWRGLQNAAAAWPSSWANQDVTDNLILYQGMNPI